MNRIRYNSEIKQIDENGSFDIILDQEELLEDWQPSFQEFIECNLYSNKRLNSAMAIKEPQVLRGGSPCDFVFNESGEFFGSYIEFSSKKAGSLDIKNEAIIEAFTEKLTDMERNNIIEKYTIQTYFIDRANNSIFYSLYIKSGNNQINKEYKIYGNN